MRFVEAWTAGSAALRDTLTGPDSGRLVRALAGLKRDGARRSSVDGIRTNGDDTLSGTVRLGLTDGTELRLTSRVTIDDERVLATPAAISTKLTTLERLRIEHFGSPSRGDISSRSGTLLASGPEDARSLLRPALKPAIELIDDAWGERLSGRRGHRLVGTEVIAQTRVAHGDDVTTSIDDDLQMGAEEVLGDNAGAFVVVDPDTQGIRALVSNPDPDEPTRSPASSAYPPGSTFKILTAAAALEADAYEPDDTIPCPARLPVDDRVVRNFRDAGHGPISFSRAFAVSCNTAFARIGLTIGADDLLSTTNRFGLRSGPRGPINVPTSHADMAFLSFGAQGVALSPLEMAAVSATIARGGLLASPGWTDSSRTARRTIAERTADQLISMMESVVSEGTGRAAQIEGARIAGKTGTADPTGDEPRSDAWFVTIAPSHQAQLVAVCFLPGGGIGGEGPADKVRDFLLANRDAW